jgi:hypothetical protein
MKINMEIIPFESEPEPPGVEYLIRISMPNSVGAMEGPFSQQKKYGTKAFIPNFGSIIDYHGKGIYGFTLDNFHKNELYGKTRCLAKYLNIDDIGNFKCHVFAALRSELSPDPEGHIDSFRTRRAWVCFAGTEKEALLFLIRKKLIQRLFGHK